MTANPFGEGTRQPGLRLGAPAMIYGEDLWENVETLSKRIDHVELVLFHTPECHNLPGEKVLTRLERIAAEQGVTFSIHLPASLEIAADNGARRDASIRLAAECWRRVSRLSPIACVMHIPYTTPTLVPVPGSYFKPGEGDRWDGWVERGLASLGRLEDELGWSDRLLVENINFSPSYLVPFLESGLCNLCLDLGHLVLGGEPVKHTIVSFSHWIREVHLHGVTGYKDHLGFGALPEDRLHKWFETLSEIGFDGVMNLEVFTEEDFEESLRLARKILNTLGFHPPNRRRIPHRGHPPRHRSDDPGMPLDLLP